MNALFPQKPQKPSGSPLEPDGTHPSPPPPPAPGDGGLMAQLTANPLFTGVPPPTPTPRHLY